MSDQTNFIIRDYQPADAEHVKGLLNDFQDYIVSIDPLGRCRRMPGFAEHYLPKTLKKVEAHEGKFLLAEIDGQLVGFVVGVVIEREPGSEYEVVQDKIARVIELYVDSAYRGLKVGKILVETIENYFRQIDCVYCWIEVFEPNLLARDFYAKAGYQVRDLDQIKKL